MIFFDGICQVKQKFDRFEISGVSESGYEDELGSDREREEREDGEKGVEESRIRWAQSGSSWAPNNI